MEESMRLAPAKSQLAICPEYRKEDF